MTEHGASDLDVQSSMAITFDEVRQATLHRSANWLRDMGTSQATAYEVCCLVTIISPVILPLDGEGRMSNAWNPAHAEVPGTLSAKSCFFFSACGNFRGWSRSEHEQLQHVHPV